MSDSPGNREVAHRVFAAEYDDADLEYSESDEERAPNYVLTPTGARANRLFLVGVLTEVEAVSDDVLRARIADPTGAFVVYAGQYQPEAVTFFESTDPPAFVAVTGKARTFSPEDSDRVFTSVRPESVNVVDAETRDRWVVGTAGRTLARAATFAAALDLDADGDDLRSTLTTAGVAPSLAAGIPVALDHYGTTGHYLAGTVDLARDALRLVAGEVDEVEVPAVDPGDPGDGVVDYRRIAGSVPEAVVDFDAQAGTTPTDAETDSRDTTAPGTGGTSTTADSGEESQGAATGSDADAESEADEAESTDVSADAGGADPDEAAGDGAAAGTDDVGDFQSEEVGDFESDGDVEDFESDGDVGDFEPGGGLDEGSSADSSGVGSSDDEAAADPEVPEDVLDEDERERIEAEYGTDFSTGTEVGEPGEAGIEPEAGDVEPPGDAEPVADEAGPATDGADAGGASDVGDGADAESAEASAGSSGAESADDGETTPTETDATEPDATEADATAEEAAQESDEPADVDLEEALMDRMAELDDGDGADRGELVESLAGEFGVDEGDVEDAIGDALMGGKCYEPADGKLKPI